MNRDIWTPKFIVTNTVLGGLARIEAARAVVENTDLWPGVLWELNSQARLRATHYSTRIEGNQLTLDEAAAVVTDRRRVLHGRERDVAEVRNYWDTLARVEEWASQSAPVTEKLIQRIAGMVLNGKRARPEPYRIGQNVIRDSASGAIVYLPPEAHDVPLLMGQMVSWVQKASADQTPTPVIAALAHYQFVTVHPYYDGNGRTGRLLATYILHSSGYGLKGVYSLEEYHSRDITAYYSALDVGGHQNNYVGRAEADLTQWLEYFISTLAEVFEWARQEAAKFAEFAPATEPEELRRLDQRSRMVIGILSKQEEITSKDVATALGLSERMARILLAEWVDSGLMIMIDPSRKARKYGLPGHIRRWLEKRSS